MGKQKESRAVIPLLMNHSLVFACVHINLCVCACVCGHLALEHNNPTQSLVKFGSPTISFQLAMGGIFTELTKS